MTNYLMVKQFANDVMHTVHLYYEGHFDDAQSFIQESLEGFKQGTMFLQM